MRVVNVSTIAPTVCIPAVASPIAAVSSDRAGMEAFFAARGVRYIQASEYKDVQARDDARRASQQFDVIRRMFLGCPEMRETGQVKDLLGACLTSVPPIAKRGVIDGIAICFINDLIGYGCFVQRDVAEGEHVGMYKGIVSEASKADASSAYIMTMNPWYGTVVVNAYYGLVDIPRPWPEMVVDGGSCGNELRFVNHIEEGALLMGTSLSAANVKIRSFYQYRETDDGIRGLFHVVFVAARDIGTGEELRYDYGSEYWKKCGAAPASSSVYRLEGGRIVEIPTTVPPSPRTDSSRRS